MDRFNYANIDCSARVHNSHRSAKSPSSILLSKKDKYMLSPCNTPGEDKFVVIELCEDISIDTVQLANFEFFSGIFKEITVKVAKTLTSDDSWSIAGTYTAKNIRGIQVRPFELNTSCVVSTTISQTFHLPVSVRDFYRFIRIEFHSNYGNEFYCPVSLLRVFGLTHMEQYKWEEWEAESRASRKGEIEENVAPRQPSLPATENVRVESEIYSEEAISTEKAEESEGTTATTHVPVSQSPESSGGASSPHTSESATEGVSSTETSHSNTHIPSDLPFSVANGATNTISTTLAVADIETTKVDYEPSVPIDKSHSLELALEAESALSSPSHVVSSSPASNNSSSAKTSTASLPTSASGSASMPIVVPHLLHSVPAVTSPGESIYRTIMTRLTFLESNSSLYMRYVEEQSRSIREAMRRLEEDVGRLEGIVSAYHMT